MGKMKKGWLSGMVAVSVLAVSAFPGSSIHAQTVPANPLVVDLSENTGDLHYGASGFLYGLGSEGLPTSNVLAPLRPQAIAQKAPDGLQHPNGDALKVAPEFIAAGGREVQIYMQDVYVNWPYENLGIADYLQKIDVMMAKVMQHPNRSAFVYVPFNEPDGNWYGGMVVHNDPAKYDEAGRAKTRQRFFEDWKTVYQHMKKIDPNARIAGPNLSFYSERLHEDFFKYAQANNVLPDVMTWHELGNDFFTDWYKHYDHYRKVERDLRITERPISINEYGRPEWAGADLGNPGQLIQWMTRLENSKVDGMLAYWTAAGTLNDLITTNNQATGGWWLYKWYGELTGHTVKVTPPSLTGPLQGLAALDEDKQQARILFGGSWPATTYATSVEVKGFDEADYFGDRVHVSVWGTDDSGTNRASGAPYVVHEGDYDVTNGQIQVPLNNLIDLSAYQMVITPDTDASSLAAGNRYEAEYAKIDGNVSVEYGDGQAGYTGTGYAIGYDGPDSGLTEFVVDVPADGYYKLNLRYALAGGAAESSSLALQVDGLYVKDVPLPAAAEWSTVSTTVFLMNGINRVQFANPQQAELAEAVLLDSLEIAESDRQMDTYEAESPLNRLSGAAKVENGPAASGGQYVGWIGNGSSNTLTFNEVTVPQAGRYRMVVSFGNGERRSDRQHVYNAGFVDRRADIEVNGNAAQTRYFYNTIDWSQFRTIVFEVELREGSNSITFSNPTLQDPAKRTYGFAPNIDRIQIAAPAIDTPEPQAPPQ
ncbi:MULTISPECIES: hypothetical protein [Saccharibacillus]|uniref:hypothetical protein n=1 Tax=Saccharibacillus TaxID=456492 RepID=UPI0019251018|nr:hypothetical protein [Saccharibacillus sp. WB 17]